jgi:uncharacterized protein (TIGR03083 family)
MADDDLWALAHAERAALVEDLETLEPQQWRHPTLCGDWDVEQVVAHMVAGASVGRRAWLRSVIGARLRPEVHKEIRTPRR